MSATANLGIVYLSQSQQSKEVSINAGWDVIDAGTVIKAIANTITGTIKIQRAAVTSGTPIASLWVVSPADTGMTASVEAQSVTFDFSAPRQFATGALTSQRAMQIIGPTYAFVGASTISQAATLHVLGAPVAGTNATITNACALQVQGAAVFGSNIVGTSKAALTFAAGRPAAQPNIFYIQPVNSGNLTASTEAYLSLWDPNGTINFATGAITNQRENWYRFPTYSFVGASTITNAATVAIEGAPAAGANATLTNSFALWIQSGGLRCQGHHDYSGGSAETAAAGANNGAGPPAPVITAGGNDTRANITFGSGTGAAAGAQVVVTFNATYTTAPFVFVTAKNAATQALGLYVSATSATSFTLASTNAPASGQGAAVFNFDYVTMA